MKPNLFLPILTVLCSLMVACSKNNDAATIKGKWSVVSDSIAVDFPQSKHETYKGAPGDYFDFRNDGKVYVKEAAVFDTLNYALISDHSIKIQGFGWNLNGVQTPSTIKHTSPNSINITTEPGVITPEGPRFRSVNLVR
jgi:hypothetical protein